MKNAAIYATRMTAKNNKDSQPRGVTWRQRCTQHCKIICAQDRERERLVWVTSHRSANLLRRILRVRHRSCMTECDKLGDCNYFLRRKSRTEVTCLTWLSTLFAKQEYLLEIYFTRHLFYFAKWAYSL